MNTQSETQRLTFMNIDRIAFKIKQVMSLLALKYHSNDPGSAPEKYQRNHHFGQWINDPNDNTCYNTRNKILIESSQSEVTFNPKNRCRVQSGYWVDPYTDQVLTQSNEVQIDHLVPLKNAYSNGADKWDFKARCLYANFVGNSYHLLAVKARENMSKGDRGPEAYQPPDRTYRCQYLRQWLAVKLVWKLRLTPQEVHAIQNSIQSEGCHAEDFHFSEAELDSQRQFIQQNYNFCGHLKDRG